VAAKVNNHHPTSYIYEPILFIPFKRRVGIGKAVVIELLKLGASRVVTCGRGLTALREMEEEVNGLGYNGEVIPLVADVSSTEGRNKLMTSASELLGKMIMQPNMILVVSV
jgi:NAD(P)-dependent dehydrogenase (short-subunit alcohol dehydrogenase family)